MDITAVEPIAVAEVDEFEEDAPYHSVFWGTYRTYPLMMFVFRRLDRLAALENGRSKASSTPGSPATTSKSSVNSVDWNPPRVVEANRHHE